MKFARHPLWSVGFRPFFILTCLAGLSLPLWWSLLFTGAVPPALTFPVPPLHWHAHEMFYGFGWALLGGFLLTASKNWVGVRGWHGGALVFLAAAWLLDRAAMSLGADWPPALFWLASGLFQTAVAAMLLWTLFFQRVRGAASDNYFFWIVLPLFLPAKFLIVQGDYFAIGAGMTLALFRVAFLVMLERTQVQFMRHAFRLEILCDPKLDQPIKWLGILLVFADVLPAPLGGLGELVLALLLIERFCHWHPRQAFSRLDIGIMYFGYLGIVAQLLVSGVGRFAELPWVGTVGVHLFTVGVIGPVVPAMIVRIANGHTGRPVSFTGIDKAVLWIMLAGFAARVVGPQFHPAGYALWLHLAATCWLAGFGVVLWRFAPLLLAPRVDGREH
ncbi:MAG: NnrS family protein [Pseudomonadota bacterium]